MAHLAGSDNAVTCEGSNEANYQPSLTAYLICLSSCSFPGSQIFFNTVTQTHTAEYTSVMNTHKVTHTHYRVRVHRRPQFYTHTHTPHRHTICTPPPPPTGTQYEHTHTHPTGTQYAHTHTHRHTICTHTNGQRWWTDTPSRQAQRQTDTETEF